MNDTPDWVLKEAAKRCAWHPSKTLAQLRGYLASSASFTELCRAIEQHGVFRREVSDAAAQVVKFLGRATTDHARGRAALALTPFVIPAPKPDPLVEAMADCGVDRFESWADQLRAALEARGLEIREKNDD